MRRKKSKSQYIRRTRANNLKELIWRRQVLSNRLTVVCDVRSPHMITIQEILLAGIGSPLPYAFCPEHQVYFGVSADIDMKNKTIVLKDTLDSAWLSTNETGDWVNYTDSPYYISWYRGHSSNHAVGFENSTNGISWVAYASNPILAATHYFPYVVKDGDC